VYVPSTYEAGVPIKTVIYAHGYNMNCYQTNEVAGYTTQQEARNFLLLTPCAIGSPVAWSLADVPFFEAFLAEAKANYDIDSDNLYMSGFSNGGSITELLTCYHPEWFSGAASNSGWQLQESMGNYTLSNRGILEQCNASYSAAKHPIPILHIHGHDDDLVPYYGMAGLPSVHDDFYNWAQLNNCTGGITIKRSNELVDETFEGCAHGGSRLISLWGIAHEWVHGHSGYTFDSNIAVLDHFGIVGTDATRKIAAAQHRQHARAHKHRKFMHRP
jgi:poly(3-hydroxybutyrate) depolymerase